MLLCREPTVEPGVGSAKAIVAFGNRVGIVHVIPVFCVARLLNQHVGRQSDLILAKALRAYAEGRVERALAMMAEAAMGDPYNLRVPLTLAKVLIREQRQQEAHQLPVARYHPLRDS